MSPANAPGCPERLSLSLPHPSPAFLCKTDLAQGSKGPVRAKAKTQRSAPRGRPPLLLKGGQGHLALNAWLRQWQRQYFASGAPGAMALSEPDRAAFLHWPIRQRFQERKGPLLPGACICPQKSGISPLLPRHCGFRPRCSATPWRRGLLQPPIMQFETALRQCRAPREGIARRRAGRPSAFRGNAPKLSVCCSLIFAYRAFFLFRCPGCGLNAPNCSFAFFCFRCRCAAGAPKRKKAE